MQPTPFPADLFLPDTRVLFVFAHQDDELGYAGLIQRVAPTARFLWVTNGDGLADELDMHPRDYASARRLETTLAMKTVGVAEDRLRFLGNSEQVIYRTLIRQVREPSKNHEVFGEVRTMASQVTAEVLAFQPDVVFTVAWQGGNPEHDLVHMIVRSAIGKLARPVRLFELPEYELLNLVPLRFPPWHKGAFHEIRLTPAELDAKERMAGCYPTQDRIVTGFRRVINALGRLSAIRGRPFSFRDFAAIEPFGPVPADRDHRRPPHGIDALEYLGDSCDGIRMSYTRMLAPLVPVLFPD